MKYLIEVPDETGQAYYNIAPYTEPNEDNAMWIDGYEKGVEAGRNDAWELAGDIAYRVMSYGDCLDADMLDKNEKYSSPNGVLDKLTYQEAKDKYDAWKKSKEEICVGDEVKDKDLEGRGIVTCVLATRCDVLWLDGSVSEDVPLGELHKTGRHFNVVEELLKKMKEQ